MTKTCGTYTSGQNSYGTLSNGTCSSGTKTCGIISGGGSITVYCGSGAIAENSSSNRVTCTSGTKGSGTHGSGLNYFGSQTQSISCGSHGKGSYGCGDCYSGTIYQGSAVAITGGAALAFASGQKSCGTQNVWNNAASVQICGSGTNSNAGYSYGVKDNSTTVDITCS